MRDLAMSYLAYAAVMLVAGILALAIEACALAATAHFGPIRIDGPRLAGVFGHDGLMALTAFLFAAPAIVGAAVGLRLVRTISWVAWRVEPTWRYLAAMWSMLGLLAFGLSYMFFLERITAFEGMAAFGLAIATLGFGVHVVVRRSELATPR